MLVVKARVELAVGGAHGHLMIEVLGIADDDFRKVQKEVRKRLYENHPIDFYEGDRVYITSERRVANLKSESFSATVVGGEGSILLDIPVGTMLDPVI